MHQHAFVKIEKRGDCKKYNITDGKMVWTIGNEKYIVI